MVLRATAVCLEFQLFLTGSQSMVLDVLRLGESR